ncbi:MAG: TMEM175 family protein [Syntrophobacteraceae bacterium]|jgi:uncharacterized membrane protein
MKGRLNQSTLSGTGRHSTTRIEALSDGVFAIAMTLMIFYIKVPQVPSERVTAELTRRLLDLWPQFLVYVISFVMLGVYWVGHHNQYRHIRRTNRILLWINNALLLSVTLIPFSTSLVGSYPTHQVAVILYATNLVLVGVVLFCHWRYATSRHALVDRNLDPTLIRLANRRILMGPALLALAIAFSFVSTLGSLALCGLVPVFYIMPGKIDHFWEPTPSE